MNKKIVAFREEGKIVQVCEVVSFDDEKTFKEFVEAAAKNANEIKKAREEEQSMKEKRTNLSIEINRINNEILKNEVQYLKGEIPGDEYEYKRLSLIENLRNLKAELKANGGKDDELE